MKTPKHSGKTSEKKTTPTKPGSKPSVKKPNPMMEDDDFDVPLDDIGELDDFNSFEDEDDY